MALDRWCDGVGPSSAVVPCGDQQHRVTWRRGKLVLEDHDLGAERALMALGGDPCACMRVLKMWRDQWALPPDMFRRMASWLGPNAYLAPAELETPRQLGVVLNWERSWRRDARTTNLGSQLAEELSGRAEPPLRRHLTAWTTRLDLPGVRSAEVRLARAGYPASLEGSMDSEGARATAHLDVTWLHRVWGRGVAVVDDGFVLQVLEDEKPSPAMVVRAGRWHPDGPPGGYRPVVGTARVTRDGAGWVISWLE